MLRLRQVIELGPLTLVCTMDRYMNDINVAQTTDRLRQVIELGSLCMRQMTYSHEVLYFNPTCLD